MVRGRRVRAVVACAKSNECCSPSPKRKDYGALNGRLSHALLTPKNNGQTIKHFFHTVGVDLDDAGPNVDDYVGKPEIAGGDVDSLISDGNDLDDDEKEEFKEIITTPSMKGEFKNVMDDLLSPPTPHRIELCQMEEDDKVRTDDKIMDQMSVPPKKNTAAPKAKRRLNNNQTSNQQIPKSDKTANNHKLTEYFPVRRSVRKTKKVVLEEKQRTLEDTLRKGLETGLRVKKFEGKGRGIIAAKVFDRGDFVVEYAGDLIDIAEAKHREMKYAQDQNTGCYMYYFKHKGQQYCIDATAESTRLGRLVNHSRNGNLITRTVDVDMKPRLVLIARDTIEVGEEVTYDYGDRSKESLQHHPWLAY